MLMAEAKRTNTPATVPPAMAPLLDFDGEGFGGWELEAEVELVEVELVEAGGWRSQLRRLPRFGGGDENTVCEMRDLEK